MKRTSWKIAVACCIALSFSSADLFARGFAGGAGISQAVAVGGGGGHPRWRRAVAAAERIPVEAAVGRVPVARSAVAVVRLEVAERHMLPRRGPAVRAPAGGGGGRQFSGGGAVGMRPGGGGGHAPAISRTPAFSHPNFSARTAGGASARRRTSCHGHPTCIGTSRGPASDLRRRPATGAIPLPGAGTRLGAASRVGNGNRLGGGDRFGGGAAGAIGRSGAAGGARQPLRGQPRGNYQPALRRQLAELRQSQFQSGQQRLPSGLLRSRVVSRLLERQLRLRWRLRGRLGGGGYGPGWGYGRGWGYGPGYGLGLGLGLGYGLAPLGWGYGGWGLGGMAYNSGYLGYSNPYYNSSYAGYNYAQPIPVDYGASPTAARR